MRMYLLFKQLCLSSNRHVTLLEGTIPNHLYSLFKMLVGSFVLDQTAYFQGSILVFGGVHEKSFQPNCHHQDCTPET